MHPHQTELRPTDPRYGAFPTPTPPASSHGVPVFVWVLIAAAVLVVGLAVSFGIGIAVGARAGRHTAVPIDDPTGAPGNASPLPAAPSRDIPSHDVAILDGCTSADLDLVETRIDKAIALGAPTYNRGDFQGCFTTYESTARDIESSLPARCKGPATALARGRAKAATQVRASDKAWAMRDAFDGMLDVIDRSR